MAATNGWVELTLPSPPSPPPWLDCLLVACYEAVTAADAPFGHGKNFSTAWVILSRVYYVNSCFTFQSSFPTTEFMAAMNRKRQIEMIQMWIYNSHCISREWLHHELLRGGNAAAGHPHGKYANEQPLAQRSSSMAQHKLASIFQMNHCQCLMALPPTHPAKKSSAIASESIESLSIYRREERGGSTWERPSDWSQLQANNQSVADFFIADFQVH